MSDMDDNDMGKFGRDPADKIKPIDTAGDGRPSGEFVSREKERARPKAKILDDGTVISAAVAEHVFDDELNWLHKGDHIDIKKKVPALRELYVAAGWEQKGVEEARIDLDLSCFLLNKADMTRDDSDFLFYNNTKACDGAVTHLGDNRVGAGDGDDETIVLDLNGIPFDVLKIIFVLSIYEENAEGFHFGQLRNIFVRLVNKDDNQEIVRLKIPDDAYEKFNAMQVISLIREGPKWIAAGLEEPFTGGLTTLAKKYGIIVQEDTG